MGWYSLRRVHRIIGIWGLLLATVAGCSQSERTQPAPSAEISGRLDGGLRVLTIDPLRQDQQLTIYRGDYVRAERPDGETFRLRIPSLDVDKTFPTPRSDKPYFKVPEPGTYEFTAGEATGVIEAIEYRAAAYREVTADEAAEFIVNLDPVILDVRTRREYVGGHLAGSRLVPIHSLQSQLADLEQHRDRPVLVYCRTGNRSTVAAKILVDHGFRNVVNLRRGIVEWNREGLPIERRSR